MGIRQRRTVDGPHPIGKERQRTFRRQFRIELAQCACRGIARIDKQLLAPGRLSFVKPGKILFHHQHFAAHLEQGGRRGLQTERDRADGAQILGDILADRAIASGRALYEYAVLVTQIDGQTVELGLAGVFQLVINQAETFATAAVEVDHILLGKGIAE